VKLEAFKNAKIIINIKAKVLLQMKLPAYKMILTNVKKLKCSSFFKINNE
jgi:hypothetical protein